jgi:membrane protein CcdC involved in cytochrome C biogenesis
VVVLALMINSVVMFFLPFSTYRETGGVLRFACGLVLSVLLFTSRFRMKRVLNYSFLWLVLNVFLLKS